MADEPAIVVDDLSFRYVGRKRHALSNVSFSVDVGETLLVLGPSGGGKSTLALCLNGLIPHDVGGEMTGRVRIAGRDTREAPVAALSQSVGLIFQDPDAQFSMLRVDDELAFGLENVRTPAGEMPARIARALDQVGLNGRERSRIDRLSGGTRQRVALAAVLALDPPILVFDEPTSNLDPAGAEEVFAALGELKRGHDRTLVIVEHRLDRLMGLVDKVLVLDDLGRVAAHGHPRSLLREQAAALKRSGVWVPQVSEVANRLAAHGISSEPYPLTVEEAATTYGRLMRDARQAPFSPIVATAIRDRSNVSSEPAIAISRLSYTYPGGVAGLRDVSLDVHSGAFLAVVGPNGAGKTTLARHLIGSIRPPTGTVFVHGRDVRTTPAAELARQVGYVFQNPEHQFVARTIFDELAFGPRLRGDSPAEVEDQVSAMLESFGLAPLARANPFSLSHGEKRRLSVATMLILGQNVLVLDEPTFGQDRQNTDALMARLVDLNRAGRTIVMITHDPRLVAEYAKSVVVLVGGKVVYDGAPDGALGNAELLGLAHLTAPPVRELAQRLAAVDPSFPPASTVDRLVDALLERLPTGVAELVDDAIATSAADPVLWTARLSSRGPR